MPHLLQMHEAAAQMHRQLSMVYGDVRVQSSVPCKAQNGIDSNARRLLPMNMTIWGWRSLCRVWSTFLRHSWITACCCPAR